VKCDYRISFDLVPYGDIAIMIAFGLNDAVSEVDNVTSVPVGSNLDPIQTMKMTQVDVVRMHQQCLTALLKRCPREPRWHCAFADVSVNPIVLQRLSSSGDYKTALRSYLVAASLATNFFADNHVSVLDIIDHSSLIRLVRCIVIIFL